ncbi:uncharacterized protein LOC103271919 [Carlito syrichta]|uniref:Programmed cell death protein 5 n=3 Tax=Boreoeutheria TaxID=1437010 RepID=A0A3Q0EIJ8_CARSF|nr:uncharacterized protein LOC103271919 [Carlito syrichta]
MTGHQQIVPIIILVDVMFMDHSRFQNAAPARAPSLHARRGAASKGGGGAEATPPPEPPQPTSCDGGSGFFPAPWQRLSPRARPETALKTRRRRRGAAGGLGPGLVCFPEIVLTQKTWFGSAGTLLPRNKCVFQTPGLDGDFRSASGHDWKRKPFPDPGDAAQQEAKHREAEMRNSILAQVLDQSARARLSNLALVKPEKTKAVENYLIQMARYGQLSGKVSEQGLIEILEKVSQQTEKKTTVKFNRRKVMDSDEEDDY